MPRAMEAPLVISSLSFHYPSLTGEGELPVLEDLSLTLPAGRITVVLGPADSGKTTLARILVGAVPRFTGGSLSGSIRLASRELTSARPYELVETIGCISQDTDEQIITTRCDTEVAFALESLGVDPAGMKDRIADSLQLVGLEGFEGRNPSTLSGGEKKRLMIACLAALGPAVWVMDESLLELDRSWRRKTLDFLQEARKTVLVLDSRVTPLLEEKGAQFGILSRGALLHLGERSDDAHFLSCAQAEGILPGDPPVLGKRQSRARLMKARGVRFQFPDSAGPDTAGFTLAVDSLELEKGSVCSLLGDNGSGKSTLGKILCGLLSPSRGALSLWAGAEYRVAAAEELNGRVGYLFQNPDAQIFLPTVFDELALGLRRQGQVGLQLRRRVEEVCGMFALPDPSAPPALMSYGARRRLQAAICYLLHRELLVLDEVDTGLSYRELSALLSVLRSTGAGILLITHDLALATSISDRILLMEKGSLLADLAPADFDTLAVLRDGPLQDTR
jgi:energy-coupling factor transport system ATP-binding protein